MASLVCLLSPRFPSVQVLTFYISPSFTPPATLRHNTTRSAPVSADGTRFSVARHKLELYHGQNEIIVHIIVQSEIRRISLEMVTVCRLTGHRDTSFKRMLPAMRSN